VTLRVRLLLASATVLGVVVGGALVLLRTQELFLVSQVDSQLDSARPFVEFRRPPGLNNGAPRVEPPEDGDAPISRLFIGVIENGGLGTVLQGRLVGDIPAVDAGTADAAARAGTPITVGGRDGATRFRVQVVTTDTLGGPAVIALPLDEVDRAVGRMRWALGAGVAVVATMLLVAGWWIERLGLRPVARVTAAADAIGRGDREHRVSVDNPKTEAGKLATAFNVMLDERDASEEHLRQFIADASHELRTPLTSIRGYLDLYREGGFRAHGELDDMVRRVSQESSRMHELVEDLLLLARLDQHRPLRLEPVDVGVLLHDAATDARVLQPERRIKVEVSGPEPVVVVGDHFRLQQVVGALVANALMYTDLHAAVRLRCRPRSTAAEITVADDGPGLAAADAVRVFDRFFRGDRSRARRTGGSGLGLAIAKSLVEAHGGTIVLHTAPGQGCLFTITLPQGTTPEPAPFEVAGRS
jgi:two-component system, OmpR family, sensor kinase